MSDLIERWKLVCHQIDLSARGTGRLPADVQLIAVSKKHPLEAIEELYHAGQRDFGENYVQELISKAQGAQALGLKDIRWHFIGHLQRNKVKPLLPWVYRIHSVDSPALVDQLAKRWNEMGRTTPFPVLIEVNLSGEPSKSGVSPSVLADLAGAVRFRSSELQLKGLMCIPSSERKEAEQAFQQLANLAASIDLAQPELSMGMSSDYPEAIRAGATWIRVGTAIFGSRPG
jgi:pyridoxal phosphate enzyme (YggS family)